MFLLKNNGKSPINILFPIYRPKKHFWNKLLESTNKNKQSTKSDPNKIEENNNKTKIIKRENDEVGHSYEFTDKNFVKKIYGGKALKDSALKSEIIFNRRNEDFLEFKKSLLDPTIVRPENHLRLPENEDLPASIPSFKETKIVSPFRKKPIIFPPKPLQEAHENFLFKSVSSKSPKDGQVLSVQDRFNLMIDKTFEKVSKAKSGDDLVEILRNDWLNPNSVLSDRCESMRRTLEVFLQLGQIKQFAFINSKKLDSLLEEIVEDIKNKIPYLTSTQLADIFWSFAKMGARPASIINKLVAKVESKLSQFSMGQISDIFYSFEELRIKSPKLYKNVERSVIESHPRTLKELTPTQLIQLSYGAIIGTKIQNQRRDMCWHLCREIGKMWKPKPFVPLSSMLQLCRFTTAINILFQDDRFKGLIPNDLREKALFLFKSGRAEMYSPPFLDPMARDVVKAHITTMMRKQNPLTMGINGWWLWSLDRRNPPFSVEPASKSWYTRLDDKRRMLGSYMFRNHIIERHGLYSLHIPFYEWEKLVCFR
ncbi:hypothetical protein MHBO_002450, partial [Bonamia ostreae]